MSALAMVPLTVVFSDRSKRWIADNARAGRIPGAIKVGNVWFIGIGAAGALASGTAANDAAPAVPTVDDALADLRARGIV